MILSPGPATLRDVVALLYRADWTALSLSATLRTWTDHGLRTRMRGTRPPGAPDDQDEPEQPVTETSKQVLVAPGGKFRISNTADPGLVSVVCDGESAWSIFAGRPEDGPPRMTRGPARGPGSGLDDMLRPASLLSQYTLDLAGTEQAGGRPAYHLVARPRLSAARRLETSPDQLVVLVDAELGILLRREALFHRQPVERAELAEVRLDPPEAADPGQFQPPDLPAGEHAPLFGAAAMTGRPGYVVRAAAGAAATAMGFAVRHWPGPAAETVSAMPVSGAPMATEWLEPAGDDLVNLLYRTGMSPAAGTVEVHKWTDGGLLTHLISAARESVLPPALDGILGPDAVWAAVADRAQTTHQVVRLRLAADGRYRIDRPAGGRPSAAQTTASDGERQWLVRDGKATVRRFTPLERELACLADPAWLLAGYTLWAGGPAEVAGRRGFLVVADRDAAALELPSLSHAWLGSLATRVEAVVDPDIAVLLRVACFAGGDRPFLCFEMRDLVAGAPDAGAFEVPPGAGSGQPLDGYGLPSPTETVKAAAGLGMAGAAALVGWLQKRPRGHPDGGRG